MEKEDEFNPYNVMKNAPLRELFDGLVVVDYDCLGRITMVTNGITTVFSARRDSDARSLLGILRWVRLIGNC